jgi:hypothetical protein
MMFPLIMKNNKTMCHTSTLIGLLLPAMSSLDWSDGGQNPYNVLGLENGPEASEDDIKKVGVPACCLSLHVD